MDGGAFGTPEYAPPEQMTGDLANVGPRSDVYGLGAVLYCLMTGRAPFSRQGIDLGKLIAKVEAGDFPPPRQVRPDVDKPLEAICLKAMGRKPADRYETVRALAADVEHYLADEPVTAYREPLSLRARRWARRHRTAVTATVAALAVAAVGLGAITAVQTRARNDLAAKNTELEGANRSLAAQRRRAEDRESQAIDAVKRFGDVIADEPALKDTPALGGLRERLLKEPLAFFRSLRDRLQADRDTRPESLARLANASFELGHLTAEIGDEQDALIAYRESLAIQQALAEAHPAVAGYRRDLARSHNNIGVLLGATGEPAGARAAHEAARAIQQALADAHPAVVGYRSDLAKSYNNIGVLLGATGEPSGARAAHEAARAIQQALADAHPAVAGYRRELAQSHNNIGILLHAAGEPAEALAAFEAARAIFRALAEAHPAVAGYRSDLARSHHNIGLLLGAADEPAEALAAYEAAQAIFRALAEAHPAVAGYRSELAKSHYTIGVLLSETGEPAEALAAHQAARAIFQAVADAHPAVPSYRSDLAMSHTCIGLLLDDTGRPAEALAAFEAARAIQQALAREQPNAPDLASNLGGTLNNMAMLDLDARRFEEACLRLREAVEWQRKALAANAAHPTYRQFLDNHLNNLIRAARGLNDSEAEAEAERELAELRDSDPAMVALDARLSAIIAGDRPPKDNAERLRLGQRAYDKALYAAAARLWAEALAANPKLGDDRQAQPRYNAACAAALAGSGQGTDDPKPDEAARTKLRAQALGWLQAELSAWELVVLTVEPGNKELVARTLAHWKADADLAGVRDAAALEQLPEAERADWRAIWADVEKLLVGTERDGS